jgi:hypothetical protein
MIKRNLQTKSGPICIKAENGYIFIANTRIALADAAALLAKIQVVIGIQQQVAH